MLKLPTEIVNEEGQNKVKEKACHLLKFYLHNYEVYQQINQFDLDQGSFYKTLF